ncbi:hypothetical protein K435DRAFT_404898 [Dendrothele bispora CBS 962.96]|uniref:Uncharacterized protein n=1 Tax=Dendrothele bispora (strain CBS 962.96) TaxID=1314807 RepID=A0A4S8L6X1_DENBC|nr:hypothetical protein K435DRAFT_404898 [Dendrothele bispora CBS 962.96]
MNLGVSATLTRRRRGNRHRWGHTTSPSSSPGDDDSTTHGDSKIDVDRWYAQVTRSLQHLGMVGRLTGSLGVIAEYDKFHFRMLHVVYLCCRLLVLQQATLTARTLFTTTAPSTNSDNNKPTTTTTADNDNSGPHPHPHPSSESKSSTSADSSSPPHLLPHNLEILTLWGREAHSVSESILALLLDPDIAFAFGETPNGVPRFHGKEEEGKGGMLINALPDRVFDMITFAAVFLVSFRFLVWNGKSRRARREEGERGAGTVGSADVLLERVRRVLEEAACFEDAEKGADAEEEEEVRMMEYLEQLEHPAKKSAMLIGAVMRLWENRGTMVRGRGREGEGQNWEKDIHTRENMVDSDMSESLGVASVNSSNAHDTITGGANRHLQVPIAELELGQVEGTERLCSTQFYGSDNVIGNGLPMMSEQLPPSHIHHHQRSYVAESAGGPSPGPHLISPLPPHPGPSHDSQSIPPTTRSTHAGNTLYTSPDSIPQIHDIMSYDSLATPFQAQPQPPPNQPQAFHDFDFDPYAFFQMFAPPPPGPIGYTTGGHTNRTGDNWMDLDEFAIYGYDYWDPQFQVGNGL